MNEEIWAWRRQGQKWKTPQREAIRKWQVYEGEPRWGYLGLKVPRRSKARNDRMYEGKPWEQIENGRCLEPKWRNLLLEAPRPKIKDFMKSTTKTTIGLWRDAKMKKCESGGQGQKLNSSQREAVRKLRVYTRYSRRGNLGRETPRPETIDFMKRSSKKMKGVLRGA